MHKNILRIFRIFFSKIMNTRSTVKTNLLPWIRYDDKIYIEQLHQHSSVNVVIRLLFECFAYIFY